MVDYQNIPLPKGMRKKIEMRNNAILKLVRRNIG